MGAGIWPGSEAKRRTDGAGGWWGGARVEMCGFLFLSRLKENGWKGGGKLVQSCQTLNCLPLKNVLGIPEKYIVKASLSVYKGI